MSTSAEDLMTLIEDCETRESKLTDWERGFISSVRSYLEKFGRLSKAQEATLEQIWEKATAGG